MVVVHICVHFAGEFERPTTSLLLAEWMAEAMVSHSSSVLMVNCRHPSPVLSRHLVPSLKKRLARSSNQEQTRQLLRNSLKVVNVFENNQFVRRFLGNC